MNNQPGDILDIAGSVDPETIDQTNWEIAARMLWKRQPTYSAGVPNNFTGPPTSGVRVVNEIWRDKNLALYICTAVGVPDTWVQIGPAIVAANPTGIATGYWIVRRDLNFRHYRYDGAAWVELFAYTLRATISAWAPGAIAGGASATTTVTVTGAGTNDAVAVGLPAAPTAGIVYQGFVSSANTVTLRATNATSGSITPSSADFKVIVTCY